MSPLGRTARWASSACCLSNPGHWMSCLLCTLQQVPASMPPTTVSQHLQYVQPKQAMTACIGHPESARLYKWQFCSEIPNIARHHCCCAFNCAANVEAEHRTGSEDMLYKATRRLRKGHKDTDKCMQIAILQQDS